MDTRFVLFDQYASWNNEVLKAEMVTEIPAENERDWWRLWVSDGNLETVPELTFQVWEDAPFPDNYWYSSALRLFSERLVTTLTEFNVKCETYPVQLVGRISGKNLSRLYYAFRLTDSRTCVDQQLSVIKYKPILDIVRLALIPDCLNASSPMFRLQEFQYIIVISAELKTALEQAEISGFAYIPVGEFQDGPTAWLSKRLV